MGASSCGSGPVPAVDLQLYAGSSEEEGIVRKQANEVIKCSSESINGFVCMSYEDLEEVYLIIQQCKQWPKSLAMMPLRQQNKLEDFFLAAKK